MKNKSKKGFTLVEIMIVVVIIGLLAALAVPAFQKVRENAIVGAMRNDARLVSSAVNQIALEESKPDVDEDEFLGDGLYIEKYSEGVTLTTTSLTLGVDETFTLNHPLVGDRVFEVNSGREVTTP